MRFLNLDIKNTFFNVFNSKRKLHAMRGNLMLRRQGMQDKATRINEQISSQKIDLKLDTIPIMNMDISDLEIAYKQFLLINFGGYALSTMILRNIGSKDWRSRIYPVPRSWRIIIQQNQIEVNNLLSDIFWQLRLFLNGCLNSFKILKLFFSTSELSNNIKSSNYSVFFSVSELNVSSEKGILNEYSVYSDIARIEGFQPNQILIGDGKSLNLEYKNYYGNKVVFTKSFWASFLTFREKVELIPTFLKLILLSISYSATRNLTNFLFIKEIFIAHIVMRLNDKLIGKNFYFNNGAYIYRPLWTYFVETPQKQISMYFYSSNIQQFSYLQSKYPNRMHFGYSTMNWPRYLAWDECQADFLKKINKNKEININGPIEYGGIELPKKPFKSKTLAIFDVTPVRKSTYDSLAVEFDYYTYENAKKFVEDIVKIATKMDYDIIYKSKRPASSITHKGYKNFIKNLAKTNMNFFVVEPNVAASSIIKSSELVISMPFTSTALLGLKYLKKSIFYDATCLLEERETASSNVIYLRGIAELEKYFQEIKNN